MRKYEKPWVRREVGMKFVLKNIHSSWHKLACRQCSSCHGCRG